MMRILYIVPNPPSLVRVRPYNLIRGLADRGHQITLATVWSTAEEREDIERLRRLGLEIVAEHLPKIEIARNLARASVAGLPFQAAYSQSTRLKNRLADRLAGSDPGAGFDVVHAEHLRGAGYGLHLKSLQRSALPTDGRGRGALPLVWDSVDCISYLFEQAAAQSRSRVGRIVTRIELGRTRRYEGWLARQFDRVLITSDVDRRALASLAGGDTGLRLSVLPNGVDLQYFAPSHVVRAPATVVFTGKMSYHANITAALHLLEDIMPRVWAGRADVHLVIAGKDPPREITAFAHRYTGQVSVTGTVADIRPHLWQATLAAVPLVYGAGSQFKVLEAMACGTPVVASRRATAALQVVDREHLLVADDAVGFAAAILRLLEDEELQNGLASAGRSYVEQHHDWSTIVQQLEGAYLEVLGRSPAC